MTTNRKMQSALRASLEKEDAALSQRLPAAAKPRAPMARRKASSAAPEAARRSKNAAAPAPAQPKPAKMPAAPARRSPGLAQVRKPVRAAPAKSTRKSTLSDTPQAAVDARPKSSAKPEKRIRRVFSIAAADVIRIEALRATVATEGGKCRRSSLVRAGLLLLSQQDAKTIAALVDALPAIRKKGRPRK